MGSFVQWTKIKCFLNLGPTWVKAETRLLLEDWPHGSEVFNPQQFASKCCIFCLRRCHSDRKTARYVKVLRPDWHQRQNAPPHIGLDLDLLLPWSQPQHLPRSTSPKTVTASVCWIHLKLVNRPSLFGVLCPSVVRGRNPSRHWTATQNTQLIKLSRHEQRVQTPSRTAVGVPRRTTCHYICEPIQSYCWSGPHRGWRRPLAMYTLCKHLKTPFTRYSRLSNRLSIRLDNRFDNRLCRVNRA